jgi:uptake hydrogenase large subunit
VLSIETTYQAKAKLEQELDAEVYVNRNSEVTRATFRTTLYQGDKGILDGQPSRAGLSAWPRIFSFCGGSHQLAAVLALEHAWQASPPPNARLLRSIAQAAEIMQNASRWLYTSFGPDLANPYFSGHALHEHTTRRFIAFKGASFQRGMIAGALPTALYALFAGQWPYADFLIPGGANTSLTTDRIQKAFALLERYRREWLEPQWLGCSLERYLAIHSWEGLLAWLDEADTHRNSDLGLALRAALAFGLDKMGSGAGKHLGYGAFWGGTAGGMVSPEHHLLAVQLPGGYLDNDGFNPLDTAALPEYLAGAIKGKHYFQEPAEVGPLSRMMLAAAQPQWPGSHPLIADIVQQRGASVLARALARMHELCLLFMLTEKWIAELDPQAPCASPVEEKDGCGIGLTEAPRGALAHQVCLKNGKIESYTILAPTILNIQPYNPDKQQAPLAQALQGLEIHNLEHPFEVGLVARSFDSCLACNTRLLKNRSGLEIWRGRV